MDQLMVLFSVLSTERGRISSFLLHIFLRFCEYSGSLQWYVLFLQPTWIRRRVLQLYLLLRMRMRALANLTNTTWHVKELGVIFPLAFIVLFYFLHKLFFNFH